MLSQWEVKEIVEIYSDPSNKITFAIPEETILTFKKKIHCNSTQKHHSSTSILFCPIKVSSKVKQKTAKKVSVEPCHKQSTPHQFEKVDKK